MRNQLPSFLVSATLIFVLCGCPNMAQFQTASVLDVGEVRVGGGASFSAAQHDAAEVGEPADLEVDGMFQANVYVGVGVAENVEFHGRAWFPLGTSVGMKGQLIGGEDDTSRGFDLSLGVDVGYQAAQSSRALCVIFCQEHVDPPDSLDLELPVYLGYRINEALAIYATPRYSLRRYTEGDTMLGSMVSGTLGFEIRDRARFFFEASGGYDLTTKIPFLTIAFGGGL